MQQIDQFIDFVGLDHFDFVDPVMRMSKFVGCRRPSYLVLLYLVTTIFLMYLGWAPQFQSDLIGFGYPAYRTLKSFNSLAESQMKWIIYWISYCLIILSNRLLLYLVQANLLYYILRSLLFVYLFTYGTAKLQEIAIALYSKYRENIDHKLSALNEQLK